MISLPELQLLIVTPPKTASRSLIEALCKGGPGVLICGPSMPPRNVVDHHYAIVPADCVHYQVLVIARHPLDRLVSLWLHWCRDRAYRGEASPGFANWCGALMRGEIGELFYAWNLTKHCEQLSGFAIVRFERLREDLLEHGVILPSALPTIGATYRRAWPDYFTPELLDLVRPWAEPDAQRFGYRLAEQ